MTENKMDAGFTVCAENYLKNGGTIERAYALLDLVADRLSGGGQVSSAEDGQIQIANPRQPNGDGVGHPLIAEDGLPSSAPPSPPIADGKGQNVAAEKAIGVAPKPVREPTKAQRSIAGAVAKEAALSSLGWIGEAKIPGGPRYTDLRVRDLSGMYERQLAEGATHARSAIALKMIEKEIKKAGVVQPDQLWVDLLSKDRVREISKMTEVEVLKPMAIGWLRGFNETAQSVISDAPA